MRFLIVLKSNLKRILKNKTLIFANFLIPLAIVLIFGFIFKNTSMDSKKDIIINSDRGVYGEEFIKELKINSKIEVYEKNDAIERLKKKRITVCYEIPENFSELIGKGEKPKIISYSLEKNMNLGNFEFNANSVINKMLLKGELKNSGSDVSMENLRSDGVKVEVIAKEKKTVEDTVVLNMLISFVFFSSIGVATEFFQLKKENILKRSFTTANSSRTIIGAILGALFILTSICYSIIFLMNIFINAPNTLNKAPIILLNLVFIVFFSLSLGVFITRIVKNEKLIAMVLQIIISLTCFVGGSFAPIEFLPKGVRVFSKFTPQYWSVQSIRTGNVTLAFVVLLFAVVLFTAGTFKVKNFID